MAATVKLFNSLVTFVNSSDKKLIKAFIGDVVNDKTLTVNQVVRYLTNKNDPNLVTFGDKVRLARKLLLRSMKDIRDYRGTVRNDAFTVNELLIAIYDIYQNSEDRSVVQTLDTLLADRF